MASNSSDNVVEPSAMAVIRSPGPRKALSIPLFDSTVVNSAEAVSD
jgi:hypothetical protein